MIDLHCHVLPGVDDGPDTLEESLELCRAAHEEGTRTLVATPHVNGKYPGVTAAVVRERVALVNQAARAQDIDVRIRTGAEVALSRVGEMPDAELDLLTLGGGRHILLELPWTSAASGAMAALQALALRGYGIVVAHPERSPMTQRDDGTLVLGLVQSGVLCCLDASSLTSGADRRTRTTAWDLLARGLVHVIASDSHDAVRRPPKLASILREAGLTAAQIDYFTAAAPQAILNGEAVAPAPGVRDPRPRRWLRRGR
jgi:protein-tyrosine phosphatase